MASLHELAALGQSVWIDDLSRPLVRGGELARLRADGATGVTSNPTIFQKAVAAGDAYDDQLRDLGDVAAEEAFWALAATDVREACDVLAPGWVSLEVDPRLARSTAATVADAARLHQLVGRENLLVKIPATREGLAAIEDTIACAIPVNVTLIFSLERHRAVAQAYLRGLRRAADTGHDLARIASVASFFISRVDTEADRRLEALGGHGHLRGTLAIANAKLAYAAYREIFSGREWDALAALGATPQRCLWASTSAKDPAYRDTLYVEELAGPETVNTMPRETIAAFLDHGDAVPRLTEGLDAAHETLAAFAQAGVDYDDVVETLEREGVTKFVDSFEALIADVEAKREMLATAAS